MLRAKARGTLDRTVIAIARHSDGVTWHNGSEGLALILTADGYALTTRAEADGATLPERVFVSREDGLPMEDGHRLTQRERERAVRAILQGTLDRRTLLN